MSVSSMEMMRSAMSSRCSISASDRAVLPSSWLRGQVTVPQRARTLRRDDVYCYLGQQILNHTAHQRPRLLFAKRLKVWVLETSSIVAIPSLQDRGGAGEVFNCFTIADVSNYFLGVQHLWKAVKTKMRSSNAEPSATHVEIYSGSSLERSRCTHVVVIYLGWTLAHIPQESGLYESYVSVQNCVVEPYVRPATGSRTRVKKPVSLDHSSLAKASTLEHSMVQYEVPRYVLIDLRRTDASPRNSFPETVGDGDQYPDDGTFQAETCTIPCLSLRHIAIYVVNCSRVSNLQQPSKPIEGPDNLSWGNFHLLHRRLGMIVL